MTRVTQKSAAFEAYLTALREFQDPLTGDDLRLLRRYALDGMTQKELAKILGVSKITVSRWEQDESPCKGVYARLIWALVNEVSLIEFWKNPPAPEEAMGTLEHWLKTFEDPVPGPKLRGVRDDLLKMDPAAFASAFGISPTTLNLWERTEAKGPYARLLWLVANNPALIEFWSQQPEQQTQQPNQQQNGSIFDRYRR